MTRRKSQLRQYGRIVEIRRIQYERRESEAMQSRQALRHAEDAHRDSAGRVRTVAADWQSSVADGGLATGLGTCWARLLVEEEVARVEAWQAAQSAVDDAERRTQAMSVASYRHQIAEVMAQGALRSLLRKRDEAALAEAADLFAIKRRMG